MNIMRIQIFRSPGRLLSTAKTQTEKVAGSLEADLETLREAVKEQRRLTVDWRQEGGFTERELIQKTARRVGLVAPDFDETKKDVKK